MGGLTKAWCGVRPSTSLEWGWMGLNGSVPFLDEPVGGWSRGPMAGWLGGWVAGPRSCDRQSPVGLWDWAQSWEREAHTEAGTPLHFVTPFTSTPAHNLHYTTLSNIM